jgi:glutathione S-transferase
MLQFGILEAKPAFSAYVKRINERPALQRADARNAAIIKEHGLKT